MIKQIAFLETELQRAERDVECDNMIDNEQRRQVELKRSRARRDHLKAELEQARQAARDICGTLLYSSDDIANLIGTQPGLERVYLDAGLCLLSVEHDGSIGWDQLQAVKELVWGAEAVAIEVYPPRSRLVNNIPTRHLWRLGEDDWWPDLGREGPAQSRTLRDRYQAAQVSSAGHDPFNGFGSGPVPIEPRPAP